MNLDLTEIKASIRMLDETDVAEISLESDGVKIHIRKASAIVPGSSVSSESGDLGATGDIKTVETANDDGVAAAISSSAEPEEDAIPANWVEVTAPVVGTFYRAPAPDAAPYVDVGDQVTEGQTLCIVEAMKLMNEIPAEAGGKIRRVLVADGTPIEYGQALFLVEPT